MPRAGHLGLTLLSYPDFLDDLNSFCPDLAPQEWNAIISVLEGILITGKEALQIKVHSVMVELTVNPFIAVQNVIIRSFRKPFFPS